MKLLATASVLSFFSMIAFGMYTWEQSIIDEMTALPDDVVAEMGIGQCVEDRRAACGIVFDYSMVETCESIMIGEAVLCAKRT